MTFSELDNPHNKPLHKASSEPDVSQLVGFPPIINQNTHTLILGSFPSKASLIARQYYGNSKNQFWELMERLFPSVKKTDNYEKRKASLLACGVGLWDVFYACQRKGSLDSNIKHAVFNDFTVLKIIAPELKRVFFNGKMASKAIKHVETAGYITGILPSSSPAHTISILNKYKVWKEALISFQPVE